MIILFPKKKGVKIATALILEEISQGASYHYILGMIDFARKFKAISAQEARALIDYLQEGRK